MKKYVYAFGGGTADGDGKMKDVLGGKGAGLAEMSRAGVPVPPGFTISTEVCNIYFQNKNSVPKDISEEIAQALADLEKKMGKKLGDAIRSAAGERALRRQVLHARHDEHHPQSGLERQNRRGPGQKERQSALRLRLLSPLHPDVRRSGARHRHAQVRSHLRRAQEEGEGQARYRPVGRRPEGHHRRLSEAGEERERQAVSAGPARAARHVARRGVPFLVGQERGHLPAHGKDSRRNRHRRQRASHGVRQSGRDFGHRRRFHAQSGHRREGLLGRVPDERARRRRGGGHSHAAAHLGSGSRHARRLSPASRYHQQPRKALSRHAGFRVHHRERQAVYAANAQWQAHRRGGIARRGGNGEGRFDRQEGSGVARGAAAAGSIAASAVRPGVSQSVDQDRQRHRCVAGCSRRPGCF